MPLHLKGYKEEIRMLSMSVSLCRVTLVGIGIVGIIKLECLEYQYILHPNYDSLKDLNYSHLTVLFYFIFS